MEINRISVSRRDLWNTCPYKYVLKYIKKMPYPDGEPYWFEYGKIVHKIAEEYVIHKGEKKLVEISNAVLSGEIEIEEGVKAGKVPPEYRKRLPGNLEAVAKLTDKVGFDGEIEHFFQYDLDPPNEKLIAGVLDRLIPKNGKFFIIDYKTTKKGRWRKTPRTIRKDLQLRTYAWAVQKKYDCPIDKIRGALHYVEGGDLVATRFNQAGVDAAIAVLGQAYDEIKATDPNSVWGRTGWHCKNCEYKSQCPYYRGS
jgi:CRISPR/Cas system-associated exonuclease Cas4 (RecB family)